MSIWSARLCLCVVALLCLTITPVDADLPVHCTHAEVQGEWVFHRGQGGLEKAGAKCSKGAKRFDDRTDAYGLGEPNYKVVDQMKVKLLEPNVAVHTNAQGKQVKGTWTMIYDEGFEVVLAGHKYFAFSKFKKGGHCEDSTQCDVQRSSCHKTFPGWYHNEQNPDKASWGCYHAHKTGTGHKDKEYRIMDTTEFLQKSYQSEHDLVKHINESPARFKAKVYPHLHGKSMHELHQMGGGKLYQIPSAVANIEEAEKDDISDLPKEMDWRSHKAKGATEKQNYVGPVINQGSCGSCYAVAVTDMIHSRVRVKTLNAKKPKLSVQETLSCSEYGQGCKGGFPFLVGKYAQDFGIAKESAKPYVGHSGVSCNKKAKPEVRATGYGYIGGYYGSCNHKKMMRELHNNGPIVVGFNTEAGLWHYESGLYESVESLVETAESDHPASTWGVFDKKKGPRLHNHWEKTTHAVLVVGYGENDQHGKFWTVKNSWGPNWGEDGYFKIQRGTDHCAFESMAVHAEPVVGNERYFETLEEQRMEDMQEMGQSNDEEDSDAESVDSITSLNA